MGRSRSSSWLLLICLVFTILGCGSNPDLPHRSHYDEKMFFSFDPPERWIYEEKKGIPTFWGSANKGLRHNITVTSRITYTPLLQTVNTELDALQYQIPTIEILKKDQFKTEDGQTVYRIVMRNLITEKTAQENPKLRAILKGKVFSTIDLRQTVLICGTGFRKYVITCTMTNDVGDQFDKQLIASVKTFRMH